MAGNAPRLHPGCHSSKQTLATRQMRAAPNTFSAARASAAMALPARSSACHEAVPCANSAIVSAAVLGDCCTSTRRSIGRCGLSATSSVCMLHPGHQSRPAKVISNAAVLSAVLVWQVMLPLCENQACPRTNASVVDAIVITPPTSPRCR